SNCHLASALCPPCQLLLDRRPDVLFTLLFSRSRNHRVLHSFPTRRSSDLWAPAGHRVQWPPRNDQIRVDQQLRRCCCRFRSRVRDRKSTRLNSSHVKISYAVFCLKKKNTNQADNNSHLTSCKIHNEYNHAN